MGWVKPESPSTPWTSTVAPKTEYKPLPSPPTVWSTGLGGIDNWEVRRLPLVNIQGKTGYVAEVTPEGKVLVEQAMILVQGSDGVKEVPVKVDAEGRLVLASDVTVNVEGLVVDLGQIKQGPPGTEPWPVELSSAGTPVPVELTGKKEALIKGTHDSSGSIASGSAEDIAIEPTVGTIAELVWFRMSVSAPPGATSGTHKVEVGITAASAHYVMYTRSAQYNEPIVFTLADLLSMTGQLRMWTFTSVDPLVIKYTNSTNVAQTNARHLRTRRIERSVF